MVHTLLELHLLRFAWVCVGQAHPSELPQGTADVWLQGKVLLGKAVAFQQGICVRGGAGARLCCFFQFSVDRALHRVKSPALLRPTAGLHRVSHGLFGCRLPSLCLPPAWKRQLLRHLPAPAFVHPDLPLCNGRTLSPAPGPLFPFPVSSKPLPPPTMLSPLCLRLKWWDARPAASPASRGGWLVFALCYLQAVGHQRASLGHLPEAACPPRVPCCLQPAGEASSQRAEPLGSRAGLHARRGGTSSTSPRQEPGLGSGSRRHETPSTPCCFTSLKPAGLQR